MKHCHEKPNPIREQILKAREGADLLEAFEKKHRAFLELHPPEIVSALLKAPWLSWPAKHLDELAKEFGNYGWIARENSREKVVDGVAVGIHGMEETVRVPLTLPWTPSTHLDCFGPTSVSVQLPGKIGHQSLN